MSNRAEASRVRKHEGERGKRRKQPASFLGRDETRRRVWSQPRAAGDRLEQRETVRMNTGSNLAVVNMHCNLKVVLELSIL